MFMQYTFENWICTELIVVLMLGNGQVLVTAITKVKLKVLFLILKFLPKHKRVLVFELRSIRKGLVNNNVVWLIDTDDNDDNGWS